ncbi:Methyltransferase domain-containing protein [Natronobacterium texcoconense]|uniref:Methyltransferase domain-containing protein n=2 Tax=Natronobacterium texcoconense TaxID=1095778 RepID=A0A1H1I0K0_NATTX|nr:Methyltransferase domain-containing protein [Natronobacterium texcoconense]
MDDASRTLETYESDVDAYVRKYREQSVAVLYGEPFLDALAGDRLLDVGCGPGSDLSTFESAGYEPVGFDLTDGFLRAAGESASSAPLVRGDMRALPFADATFDGVWSSASFLHVPRSDAAETLGEFRRVLRPDGVVFLSVKRASARPEESRDRHFEYYRPDEIRSSVADAGFVPEIVETTEEWIAIVAESK